MSWNKRHFPYFLIALSSMVITVLMAVFFPTFSPEVGDSAKYLEITRSLIEDHHYPIIEDEVYAPGYPIFLIPFHLIFSNPLRAVYIAQSLLVGLIAGLVYYAGRSQLSLTKQWAFLAALLVLCWPYLLLYGNLIMSEVLFIVLIFSALLLFFKREKQPFHWIISSILFAMASLTRPVGLLLPFWLTIFLTGYHSLRNKRWTFQKTLIPFLILYMLLLIPWMAFSSQKSGELALLATNLEDVVQKHNSPEKTFKTHITDKLSNIVLFWNPGADGYQAEAVTNRYPAATSFIWLYKIGFFILLTAAAGSLFLKDAKVHEFAIPIFYFWAVHSVLFPYPRYMLPLIPLIALFAMVFAQHMIGSKRMNMKDVS